MRRHKAAHWNDRTSGRSGDWLSGGWRRLLVAVTLALFVAQNYVVQTHVHWTPVSQSAGRVLVRPAQAPSNPLENLLACPFCQDFARTGHYISPSPALLTPPGFILIAVSLPWLLPDLANRLRPAWYGRAPPRA